MKNDSIHIKVLKIVESLNDEATKNVELDTQEYVFYPFEFSSDGNQSVVKFMGSVVWDTENDKIWDDNDKLVDIKGEIKENVRKFINEFNQIEL
jgi:Zn-finger protein